MPEEKAFPQEIKFPAASCVSAKLHLLEVLAYHTEREQQWIRATRPTTLGHFTAWQSGGNRNYHMAPARYYCLSHACQRRSRALPLIMLVTSHHGPQRSSSVGVTAVFGAWLVSSMQSLRPWSSYFAPKNFSHCILSAMDVFVVSAKRTDLFSVCANSQTRRFPAEVIYS